ncbi:alpha/beta hydrolase [Solihabitans fulvus]|nr:alpha/beta fold hydrolase [Solihabitans fulvus]
MMGEAEARRSDGRQEEAPLTAYLNDIRAAIDHVRGATGATLVTLVGASFGGGLVAYYAAKCADAVNRLVLLNPQLNYKVRFVNEKPFWVNDTLDDGAARSLAEQGYIAHLDTFRLPAGARTRLWAGRSWCSRSWRST